MINDLKWTPHPVWPEPVPVGRTPDGRTAFRLMEFKWSVRHLSERIVVMDPAQLREYYRIREEKIRRAKEDPLWHGYEPQHWNDADALLAESKVLCMFGGNRAGKTEYLMKRAMRLLATKENVNVLLLQNNELTSKQGHQKTIWRYMPDAWRNLKRSQEGNIRFDPKNGFSDNIFTTPLGGTCIHGNYEQALEKFEGLEFDFIGPDENMPLKWYQGLLRGLATRNGSMVWGFTPINGMTSAISEVAGGARTLQSKPVDPELLDPTLRHVDDCPVGEMPYIAEKGDAKIIYFLSEMNPFGGYDALKKLYKSGTREVRERRFYGFARKLVQVLFPKFGQQNILRNVEMLKLLGRTKVTRYHIADPAGARNMFQIWVAVDARGRHFIYREWPDVPRYGEWAVPSDDARKWDGDPGPAQPTLGYGVVDYKKMILESEGWRWTSNGWVMIKDQVLGRVAAVISEISGNSEMLLPSETEDVFERYMDPRSGAAQSVADRDGGASLMDRFEEEQINSAGVIDGPSMVFLPAPGLPENEGINGNQEGVQGINDLLAFDMDQPITALLNEPHLYVSDSCQNVIWALLNYTGRDGAKAACKDPVDVMRYMATSELKYVDPKECMGKAGRGY